MLHTVLVAAVSWCGQCHGVGSVMVWAGIHCGGRTALVLVASALTGIKYQDKSCSITSVRT